MSQENVELVRQTIDAYNRRDFDTPRVLNDPEIEVDWSASRGLEAGIYRGEDEAIGLIRSFVGMFERVKLEPESFIPSGNLVVVPNTAYMQGRDGIETVARSALVFEVRGGRVAHIRLFQTDAEALEAVGLRE